MKILLLNTNPILSRIVAFALQNRDDTFTQINRVEKYNGEYYDLLLIDDRMLASYTEEFLEEIACEYVVLFVSKMIKKPSFVNELFLKPFLPSQFVAMLESLERCEEEDYEDDDDDDDRSSATNLNISGNQTYTVLNLEEISQIKSLLSDDIQESEEWFSNMDKTIKNSDDEEVYLEQKERDFTLHISHNVKEERSEFETSLLDALHHIKLKKIKKLLKGATIEIVITFKESK